VGGSHGSRASVDPDDGFRLVGIEELNSVGQLLHVGEVEMPRMEVLTALRDRRLRVQPPNSGSTESPGRQGEASTKRSTTASRGNHIYPRCHQAVKRKVGKKTQNAGSRINLNDLIQKTAQAFLPQFFQSVASPFRLQGKYKMFSWNCLSLTGYSIPVYSPSVHFTFLFPLFR